MLGIGSGFSQRETGAGGLRNGYMGVSKIKVSLNTASPRTDGIMYG